RCRAGRRRRARRRRARRPRQGRWHGSGGRTRRAAGSSVCFRQGRGGVAPGEASEVLYHSLDTDERPAVPPGAPCPAMNVRRGDGTEWSGPRLILFGATMRPRLLPTIALLLLAGPSPARADWPLFGHDAARTAYAPVAAHITKPVATWRRYLGGTASPGT